MKQENHAVARASCPWTRCISRLVPGEARRRHGQDARATLRLSTAAALLALMSVFIVTGADAEAPHHGLKICVAADAPEAVRHAAEAALAGVITNPALSIMCGGVVPSALTDTKALFAAKPAARAFDHLVLIGLPDDPMIRAAWQREARVENGGFYIFGFGHIHGDIGYIESDRNPFLHSRFIPRAPYETEVITLTGSTPAGVALAVDAFLKQGLVNGVVAAAGWERPTTSLLDRDPLSPDFAPPEWLPTTIQKATRIGITQAGADEYRGVLEDAGIEPREIWRAKYYLPGAWDGAGADMAFEDYSYGLHRRAYGNTLWAARFDSPTQAAQAAPKIAAAARLKKDGSAWVGAQPPYSSEKESSGPLALWQHGPWLIMSTLPATATSECRSTLK